LKKINFRDNTNYSSLKFKEFFLSRDRDLILYGGAGSGKSYAVADKLALEIMVNESKGIGIKIMIVRRSLPSIRRTCSPIIKQEFEKFGISYKLNEQSMIAKAGQFSEIYFVSVNNKDDYEKAKSITDVDFIWLEEANEIPLQVYSEILKLRLRGGKSRYSQRIFTFNPVSRFVWLYDYHFIHNYDSAKKICVNIEDNLYKDLEFEKELDRLKDQNINLWRVYRKGEFGSLEGIIYPNYKTVENMPKNDNFIYGLDFGFNNPTALIKEITSDDGCYEEELIYERKLITSSLIKKMIEIGIDKKKPIYCDNAEPDRIQALCDAGFNALPADKAVNFGIDYCQRQKIFIKSDSLNLIKENETYSWATNKDGEKIDSPVKFKDHLMDARRYALYTHNKLNGSFTDDSLLFKSYRTDFIV